MTAQTPSPSALYQRANRLKKKLKAQEAKDLIEKQQIAQAKKLKQLKTQRRREGIDIESDNWGREPYLGKNPEPQYQNEDKEHYDFWGNKEGIDNILDSVSHQSNLRKLVNPDRCE